MVRSFFPGIVTSSDRDFLQSAKALAHRLPLLVLPPAPLLALPCGPMMGRSYRAASLLLLLSPAMVCRLISLPFLPPTMEYRPAMSLIFLPSSLEYRQAGEVPIPPAASHDGHAAELTDHPAVVHGVQATRRLSFESWLDDSTTPVGSSSHCFSTPSKNPFVPTMVIFSWLLLFLSTLYIESALVHI